MTIFLLAAAIAAAQPIAADEAIPSCDQTLADTGNQPELNRCAHVDYLKADADLNAQWKRTAEHVKRLDKEFASYADEREGYYDALLAAQRAWLTYRDAHCVTEGYWARGGSMEPMLVSFCLANLTTERTEQLRQLAEYPD